MNMTDEKMTDKVQAAVPADTVMQPEEKVKLCMRAAEILPVFRERKAKA